MAATQVAGSIAGWQFEKRLEETFTRTLPKLGSEARSQLAAIVTPESLAIIGGVLVAWVASHAFGVGEIIDVVILTVGVFAIGMAIFSGLDCLYDSVAGTYKATTMNDLDKAADNLAKAISILGIQAVLAVFLRGVPRTGRGGRMNIGTPPPRTQGIRYKPTTKEVHTYAAGEGGTSPWGDIKISVHGSNTDRALVLFHEKVHQFLAPKLYFLRTFRVENMTASYFRSSLWRYMEEALAETVAQVGVHGMRKFFVGVKFPVKNGYVFFTRGGGFNSTMNGSGILPEGAALLSSGMIMGVSFKLWFASTVPAKS